jgi:ferric-dicitrate binding protein FerR (iron transport regulator)
MAIDKLLLEKFIKGDCTAEEAAQVQAWLEQQPDLLDNYLLGVWNEPITEPMPAAMEAELLQEAAAMPGFHSATPQKSTSRWFYWSAAATVVLGMATWWLLGKTHGSKQPGNVVQPNVVITASTGKVYRYVLPDRSVVWLKANAQLQVDTQAYNKPLRTVQLLAGEAFFEVQKNPAHPFVVHDGPVQTRVLGTSFSVQTISPNATIQVTVATGKVEVSHNKKVLDVLLPGKQISVQAATGAFSESNVPLWLASLWKEDAVQLTGATFTELALAMEKMYGISLQTQNAEVKKKQYNIQLNRKMPAQEVIQVLALLNHNQFQKINDTTYLLY